MSSRYKKEDWLSLGERLLAEEGPPALTVERLTVAAERTRGSSTITSRTATPSCAR